MCELVTTVSGLYNYIIIKKKGERELPTESEILLRMSMACDYQNNFTI